MKALAILSHQAPPRGNETLSNMSFGPHCTTNRSSAVARSYRRGGCAFARVCALTPMRDSVSYKHTQYSPYPSHKTRMQDSGVKQSTSDLQTQLKTLDDRDEEDDDDDAVRTRTAVTAARTAFPYPSIHPCT